MSGDGGMMRIADTTPDGGSAALSALPNAITTNPPEQGAMTWHVPGLLG